MADDVVYDDDVDLDGLETYSDADRYEGIGMLMDTMDTTLRERSVALACIPLAAGDEDNTKFNEYFDVLQNLYMLPEAVDDFEPDELRKLALDTIVTARKYGLSGDKLKFLL